MKCIIFCLPLALTAIGWADTVISVSGGYGSEYSVYDTQWLETSWSSTNPYTGVDISADLSGPTATIISGEAYLTTTIGPGTTPLDQVAATVFTFPNTPSGSMTNLFSNLTLPAGTYYLTVSTSDSSGSAGWLTTWPSAGTVVTAPGVADNGQGESYGPSYVNPLYPPASTFEYTPSPLLYQVTGTLGASPVPEPSSFIPLCMASLSSALTLLWRRRPNKHRKDLGALGNRHDLVRIADGLNAAQAEGFLRESRHTESSMLGNSLVARQ